ncbi:Plasmid stabilization system protein [compost metagenome]
MKLKIVWSDYAESQLDKIFEYYLENVNYKVAKTIIEKIINEPNKLLLNPEIGQEEELLKDRTDNYRYLICDNYKIIYSIDRKQYLLKISNVFDTRQNPVKIRKSK